MLNATDDNEGTKSDRRCRCHWRCCCDSWCCFCVADAAVNIPCCCCCCCCYWCCPCIDAAASVILRMLDLMPWLQRHFLLPLLLIMLLPSRLQHPPLQLPLLLHQPLLLQLPMPFSVASSDVVYSFYHLLSLTRQHPLDNTIQLSCWIYKLIIIVNTWCRLWNLMSSIVRNNELVKRSLKIFLITTAPTSMTCFLLLSFLSFQEQMIFFVPDHFLRSSKFVSWSFSKVMF